MSIRELHSQGFSDVDGTLVSDPCGFGVEAGLEGPDGSPRAWGNDVTNIGGHSLTGFIPESSGNHHGMRYFDFASNKWNYVWND
ncbi:MAG TPA: hypothetical protein VH637_11050 [Streptosporangiaceae bacterium]|jgi:hypothetical protein